MDVFKKELEIIPSTIRGESMIIYKIKTRAHYGTPDETTTKKQKHILQNNGDKRFHYPEEI